ncbi:Tim44/TimA family putative adaptor protein [Neptunicoccus cionae]|uniref:Tim44/TimA family putative adaptor protein n=1 Tax=Neptunicoccus cionae TaxID=2035344 RepID=UPI000C76DEE8|nr:Tim44/TimA family putative adaptor protein [Amylibacter cionae]PLS22783.1 preprotein translocase subunit Tim44 [Amylibacter cionae]
MNSALIQLLVLAAIAVFLVLRLRNVLGTRDGYEPPVERTGPTTGGPSRDFEVIEGGPDPDIADHVDPDSRAGQAFAAMKRVESDFSVSEFQSGARQAYEMILMAFEGDDLDTLKGFLSPDVYESFAAVVEERQAKGLKVEANFIGMREMKLMDAMFDPANNEAEITMKFIAEITSCVKDGSGEVIEGDPKVIKRQKDVWTFARIMGSDDPNWQLVATGE